MFRWNKDWHDSSNSLFLEVLDNWIKIFWFSLYFWEHELFISNLQYTKDFFSNYWWIRKLRLHKYIFYFLKIISLKLWKHTILWYSNENHCLSKIDHFFGLYDNIYKKIWMIKNKNGLFEWNINTLIINDINNEDFLNLVDSFSNIINIRYNIL
jgi:hypothetical protein